LLLTVTDGQKCNISSGSKLELVITYHLKFVVKSVWI